MTLPADLQGLSYTTPLTAGGVVASTEFHRRWQAAVQALIDLNAAITGGAGADTYAASSLVGRGDSGDGEAEEITLGAGLEMVGETLSVTVGVVEQIGSSVALTGESVAAFTSIPTGYKRLIMVLTGAAAGGETMTFGYDTDNGASYAASDLTNVTPASGSSYWVINVTNYAAAGSHPVWFEESGRDAAAQPAPQASAQVVVLSAVVNALRVILGSGTFAGGTAYLFGET